MISAQEICSPLTSIHSYLLWDSPGHSPSKCAPEGLSQIVVHQMSSEHLGCGSQSNSKMGRVFPLHMADWVYFCTLHLIMEPRPLLGITRK